MSSINNRATPRLMRQTGDSWQISVNNDELITRNIVNISPTGIAFKAPARSQFGMGQKVSIFVQLAPNRFFECEGSIVWEKNQQYGLRFSQIPQFFDAWIMRAINSFNLEHGLGKAAYGFPHADTRNARMTQKMMEKNEFLNSALGLICIAAMTASFIMAVVVSQQNYPQYKLSNIVERAFDKRLHGPGK